MRQTAASRSFGSTASAARRAPGTFNVVYSFAGGSDAGNLQAAVIDVNGILYGTTAGGGGRSECPGGTGYEGCGTAFKVTTLGDEAVLHRFKDSADAAAIPDASLLNVGGTLYGTTVYGGPGNCVDGCGTIFKITSSGKESVVHSFRYGDGWPPYAGLLNVGGTLYGTTSAGGPNSHGTVFSIKP